MLETQEVTQAIAVEHLVKRYRQAQRNAVDDISLSVRLGETFGLLGPNGAGKTTTIGILTTSVLPNSGRAAIAGIDVVTNSIGAKQRIAVVPQRNNLDRTLRISEVLTYHVAYRGTVPRRANQQPGPANAPLPLGAHSYPPKTGRHHCADHARYGRG